MGLSPFSFGQATNGTTADFFDCTDDRFSVQQIKRIRSVIHKIDSVGSYKETKECACSRRWSSCVVDELDRHLFAGIWINLHQIAVISVGGDEVMIRSKRKAERIIERSTFRDCRTTSSRQYSEERIGNGRDPIVQAVCYVQSS